MPRPRASIAGWCHLSATSGVAALAESCRKHVASRRSSSSLSIQKFGNSPPLLQKVLLLLQIEESLHVLVELLAKLSLLIGVQQQRVPERLLEDFQELAHDGVELLDDVRDDHTEGGGGAFRLCEGHPGILGERPAEVPHARRPPSGPIPRFPEVPEAIRIPTTMAEKWHKWSKTAEDIKK